MKKSQQKQYLLPQKNTEVETNFDPSRRKFLDKLIKSGLLLGLPFSVSGNSLFDAILPTQKKIPIQPKFTRNKTNDGMVSQFGNVQAYNVKGSFLPIITTAKNDLAIMDMAARSPFIRIGKPTDLSPIMLTSRGVQIGKGKILPWNLTTFKTLIAEIKKSKTKMQGIVLLRSTLMTSFPASVVEAKQKVSKKTSATLNNMALAGFSADLFKNCKLETGPVEVTRAIEGLITEITTAREQWEACYDRTYDGNTCDLAADAASTACILCSAEDKANARRAARAACAGGLCILSTFEDIVNTFTGIVGYVTETVIQEYFVCPVTSFNTALGNLEFPNPFNIFQSTFEQFLPQPVKEVIDNKAISEAIKYLKTANDALGPFAKCLLEGEWSIASIKTGVKFAGQKVDIPYGLKVCINSSCAKQLNARNMADEFSDAWFSSMGILGALNPSVAATLTSAGIPISSVQVAAAAALSPAVISAATIILAFIVFALYHSAAVSAQLFYQVNFTDNLSDGRVCIEHATFTVALAIELAVVINNPGVGTAALFVPPVVIG